MTEHNMMAKGTHLLKRATKLDAERKYADALQLYTHGIEHLMLALKYETNESTRKIIGARLNGYMGRAELLKGEDDALK